MFMFKANKPYFYPKFKQPQNVFSVFPFSFLVGGQCYCRILEFRNLYYWWRRIFGRKILHFKSLQIWNQFMRMFQLNEDLANNFCWSQRELTTKPQQFDTFQVLIIQKRFFTNKKKEKKTFDKTIYQNKN